MLDTRCLETRGNETQCQGQMCLVEQVKQKTETERETGGRGNGKKKNRCFRLLTGVYQTCGPGGEICNYVPLRESAERICLE